MVISQDPGEILDFETTYVDKDDKVDGVVKDSTSDLLEGRVFRNRTTPILPESFRLVLILKRLDSKVHTDRHCWLISKNVMILHKQNLQQKL